MQHADQRRQPQEVRVRLYQHALDLVDLRGRRRALLLRGICEALGECGEDVKLPVRHGLELDLQRQRRRGGVDLDVLRAEVPEFVGEYDGVVVRSPGIVSLGGEGNICTSILRSVSSRVLLEMNGYIARRGLVSDSAE